MSELEKEENKIEEMEKEIAELKKKKEDMLHISPAESPKEEDPVKEAFEEINREIDAGIITKEDFLPPDPITPILNEPPKSQKKIKTEFEGEFI